eukprot:34691_1
MDIRKELFRLRNIYKKKFKVELKRIMKRNDIKNIQKDLGLEDYILTMSESKHFDELVKMKMDRYGEANFFGTLLDEDQFQMVASTRCKYFCDHGRLLLYINKTTNKIDLTSSVADLCDYGDSTTSANEQSDQMQRLKQMFSTLYSKMNINAFPNQIVAKQLAKIMDNDNTLNVDELNKVYGKYLSSGFLMKRKNVNPYLFSFNPIVYNSLIVNVGYKYAIGEATHSAIDKMMRLSGSVVISEIKDIDNFKFNDNRLMQDILHDAWKKRRFNIKEINSIKRNMVLKLYISSLTAETTNVLIQMIERLKSQSFQAKL